MVRSEVPRATFAGSPSPMLAISAIRVQFDRMLESLELKDRRALRLPLRCMKKDDDSVECAPDFSCGIQLSDL